MHPVPHLRRLEATRPFLEWATEGGPDMSNLHFARLREISESRSTGTCSSCFVLFELYYIVLFFGGRHRFHKEPLLGLQRCLFGRLIYGQGSEELR